MKKALATFALLAAFASSLIAQRRGDVIWGQTISNLPACNANFEGRPVGIIDGDTNSDCTQGGGSQTVVCTCIEGSWNAPSAIGGTPGPVGPEGPPGPVGPEGPPGPAGGGGGGGGLSGVTVTQDGDYGFNTSNPEGRMHVFDGSAGSITAASGSVLIAENSGSAFLSIVSPAAQRRGIYAAEPGASDHGALVYNAPTCSDGWAFRSNRSNRACLDRLGQLGLGTQAPEAPLHVFEGNSGQGFNSDATIATESDGLNYLQLNRPANQAAGILIGEPGDNDHGAITYDTTLCSDGWLSYVDAESTSYTCLANDGNFGVGTATPEGEVHAWEASAGSVTAHTDSAIVAESNGDTLISLLSPAANSRAILAGHPGDNNHGSLIYNQPLCPSGWQIRNNGGATRGCWASTGRLGIGVNNPSRDLVVGDGDGDGRAWLVLNYGNVDRGFFGYQNQGGPRFRIYDSNDARYFFQYGSGTMWLTGRIRKSVQDEDGSGSSVAVTDDVLYLTNTSSRTISTLTGGEEGQTITVVRRGAASVILVDASSGVCSTNQMQLAGNWNPGLNDSLTLLRTAACWVETSRADI